MAKVRIPPPTGLRCEYLRNPLGVDSVSPRFSWVLHHEERGQSQRAYQILVSSAAGKAEKKGGDVWDSGKVESGTPFDARYAGEALRSSERYCWRVRWWDNENRESDWSDAAFFEMGLPSRDDWKAKWVSKRECKEFRSKGTTLLGEYLGDYVESHALYLRKEFSFDGPIRSARAYVCGLGFYELRINGKKVGDRVLDPAQTDYRKLALYSTYDITDHLRGSGNSDPPTVFAVGVVLGNGRHIKNYGYGHPKFILQLLVEDEDRRREIFGSDETWKVSYGPLQENGLYYGERYDARLEMPGWDMPGFDDSSWEGASEVGGTDLASQMMQPIRVAERLEAKALQRLGPGVFVYDFGRNFTGWARLKVEGPRGTEVRLRHGELIHEDGTLNISTNQNAEATDVYILRGDGIEIYEPRFTYHGFRYVEVTGYPGTPTLDALEGCFVHTDVARVGSFECSNDLINRIHQNILRGQLSNLMSVPTDCPQRDERHGWLGDAHLAAEEAMFNFDMAAFFTKFLRDIQLSQKEDGSIPDTVPPYLSRLYPADPAWGAAYVTLAWNLYIFYGDRRVLEEHYDSLKRYVGFLRENAEENIINVLGKYGDWCPPGSIAPKRTSVELTSTWYYFHDTVLLSKIAEVLELEKEAHLYSSRAREIQEAFNKRFLKGGEYEANRFASVDRSPSQTSNVLPLYLDMVPDDQKANVLKRLHDSVVEEQDYHLDTGIIGTRYLLDVLTQNGYEDVAYKVATQKTYPGWGYMLEEGATTLWERWEKITGGGMNSHNHIMLGSVDAWFYRAVAGISCSSAGWERIRIKPYVMGDLKYASAALNTVRGNVRASWKKEPNLFELEVHVPVTSEAEIHIPMLWEQCTVREGEIVIWENGRAKEPGRGALRYVGVTGKSIVFVVGSGKYLFTVQRAL
jgi:alpha-L-rhamnosidase